MTNQGYFKISSSYLKIGDLFLRIGSGGDAVIEAIVQEADPFGHSDDEPIAWSASTFSRSETDGLILIALYQREPNLLNGEAVTLPDLTSAQLNDITIVNTFEGKIDPDEPEPFTHHRISLWKATIPAIVDGSYSFDFDGVNQLFTNTAMIMVYGATDVVQSTAFMDDDVINILTNLSAFADPGNITLAFAHVVGQLNPDPAAPLGRLGGLSNLGIGYFIGEDLQPSFSFEGGPWDAVILACEVGL